VFRGCQILGTEEDKRQKAIRKEEAAYKRQEMEAEKQERAIQCQLRQIANKEAKEAEKAQKAFEREERRAQKGQDKQAIGALALERKREQEKTQGARCRCANGHSVKCTDSTALRQPIKNV
jgi:hypothetical protein